MHPAFVPQEPPPEVSSHKHYDLQVTSLFLPELRSCPTVVHGLRGCQERSEDDNRAEVAYSKLLPFSQFCIHLVALNLFFWSSDKVGSHCLVFF